MNPVLVLVPAAALILGSRLWVNHVLRQHNRVDENFPGTANEIARTLLDKSGLGHVRVEITDTGDHYDADARAVRLARDKHGRKTLTAVTTAAHEVAHAVQHATGYPPFVWRAQLVKIARVAVQAGTVVLLSVPAASLISRQPLPTIVLVTSAWAVLGTAMAAQLSALPTELDASFRRALPMLQEGYIEESRIKDARKILLACSLTYVASSLVSVVNFWPWLGHGSVFLTSCEQPSSRQTATGRRTASPRPPATQHSPARTSLRHGTFELAFRKVAKPLVRGWFRLSRTA